MLRLALTALVTLDVGFVALTGAVPGTWLLVLLAATLGSLRLHPLSERAWWRGAWNLAVIAVFGLLVRNAATTGVRHLLEDGLILAAFCQVHLLNVLRRDQRPDLLFFNSFLIALVASFFSQDLTYSVAFTAHAVAFVVAVHAAQFAATTEILEPAARRALVRVATVRAGGVLAATAIVFVVWPRDFQREGFVRDELQWVAGASVGFDDEIRLEQNRRVILDDRAVARVQLLTGHPQNVPSLWRGATLSAWLSTGWESNAVRQKPGRTSVDPGWLLAPGEGWTRPHFDGSPRARVRVELFDSSGALFAPREAVQLSIRPPAIPELVAPLLDGTVRYAERMRSIADLPTIAYELAFDREPSVPVDQAERRMLTLHTFAPTLPRSIEIVARDVLGSRTPDLPSSVIAARLADHLVGRCEYLLPGAPGAARDLDEFLLDRAGAHCEFFASAHALMLRWCGIPARVVTGYRADEWSEDGRVLTIRARHAHAWVEFFDTDSSCWIVADPTPTVDGDGALGDGGDGASWLDRLEAWWTKLMRFDSDAQDGFLAALLALPGRLLRWFFTTPAGAVTFVALVSFAVWLRRRRRVDDPRHVFERAVRAARLRRARHETPRELVQRAVEADIAPDRLSPLVDAGRRLEAERYARRPRR